MIKPKDLQEALDQLEDANVSYFLYIITNDNLERKLNCLRHISPVDVCILYVIEMARRGSYNEEGY